MKKNDKAVFERLNCDSVDVKPRDYDFGEGYPEAWEYYEAAECQECGKPVLVTGEEHHRTVEDVDCDGYLCSEGPMMNYYYPLPGFKMDVEEAAKKIANLPLCIVYFHETEEYALALTGGGMDLSWEICAAFIELGYHPPVHFRLPEFAGGPNIGVERAKRVIAAMKESIRISQNWRNADMADVKRAEAYIKEVEKRKKEEKPKKK